MKALWYFLLFMLGEKLVCGEGQLEQCLSGLLNISSVPPPPTSELEYFEFEPLNKPDQAEKKVRQVIIPHLQFNCHGIITSWSALTTTIDKTSLLNVIRLRIVFVVWRPRGRGIYEQVGSNELVFDGFHVLQNIIRIENSTLNDTSYFQFTDIQPDEYISFQPGDVLGWTIDQVTTTVRSLNLVYREANNGDQQAFSIFSTFSSQITCMASECDTNVSSRSAIIPYLSLQYNVTTELIPSDLTCDGPTPVNLNQCTATTDPETPTTPTTISPLTCSGTECFPLYIPIAVPIIATLLLLVIVVIILLLCQWTRKKGKYLFKIQARQDYQLEDNPIYASAENVSHTHHQSAAGLQVESESEGALYAVPSTVLHDASARNTTNLDELFDGDCYASTYQTNGQCHIYQELPETIKVSPRARSMSIAVLQEVIKSRPPLPLRLTTSSASVARFPYNMPNTPGSNLEPSHEFHSFSSILRPNSGYAEINRPSLEGSAYLESKPSKSNTPEDTPPCSATLDGTPSNITTIRRLFHGVDDEMLRVPSALERQEFRSLTDPEDIYSKLKHSYSKQNRDSVDVVFLDQTDPFWMPASDATSLYDQLATRKFREIQRKQINITDCIGGGNFGTVYKGLWQVPGGVMEVAVKTLNPESPDCNEIKFLREAAIMGQFLHPNVVKLLGVVTVGEPLMIVLELMPKGDLKKYLRSLNYASVHIQEELPSMLLSFCREIGYGMNYLANKSFVHRDLAARNILLAEDLTCKIGDFGLSRDLEEETVYFSQGGQMPLRWTAPEALKYHQFSSASDVWSYGMLLFEIWSLGKRPFEGILTKRLMTLVHSGFCQAPPPGCPRYIYKLMVDCWHTEAEKRIAFSKICTNLNSVGKESILAWNDEDKAVSSRVRELGAPLSESKKLYIDLQYSNSLV